MPQILPAIFPAQADTHSNFVFCHSRTSKLIHQRKMNIKARLWGIENFSLFSNFKVQGNAIKIQFKEALHSSL